MKRRLLLVAGGLTALAVLATATYFGVKFAYGSYRGYYYVNADVERAGQQVQLGTDVRMRGVLIGEISDIQLVDRHARLTLKIEERFRVPKTARAVVTLKTFLGSKFVDLRFDPDDRGPYLADGDVIEDTHVGPELEDALDDGTHILEAIEPDDAATLVSELARASRGHGDEIARGLSANAELSGLFADTLRPQIEALRDFIVIFAALDPVAGDVNDLADAMNQGAPVYASAQAQADMRRALTRLVPFSDDLGDVVILDRRNLDVMYEAGDVVLSTIAARPEGLHDLVHGLYRYVYKLGGPIGPNALPYGGAAAGFVNFMGGNDQDEEHRQICDALSEDVENPPLPIDLPPICEEQKR